MRKEKSSIDSMRQTHHGEEGDVNLSEKMNREGSDSGHEAAPILPEREDDGWSEARGKSLVLPEHNADESEIMHAAFDTRASNRYYRIAWCAALYLVLGLLWMPEIRGDGKIHRVSSLDNQPVKRKVLRPPPEKPIEVVKTTEKKARKVPMPDATPDEPEPFIPPEPPPQPDVVWTDDWEIGIPDAPPAPPSGQEETIARVGEIGVEPPVITQRVLPDYPTKAMKVKMTGYVILEAVLRKDGNITDIKVLRQLGRGKFGFEEAAITALRKWQFLPGKVNNHPADVMMTLKIDFTISDGGAGS